MKGVGKRDTSALPEQILQELAAIGLTRATDVLQLQDGKVELKDAGAIKGGCAAAIASVEKTAAGWKVKFYDKLKALELLGDHLGMFGSGSREEEQNNLLEAILASTGEAMDIHDLQELQQKTASGDDLVE